MFWVGGGDKGDVFFNPLIILLWWKHSWFKVSSKQFPYLCWSAFGFANDENQGSVKFPPTDILTFHANWHRIRFDKHCTFEISKRVMKKEIEQNKLCSFY